MIICKISSREVQNESQRLNTSTFTSILGKTLYNSPTIESYLELTTELWIWLLYLNTNWAVKNKDMFLLAIVSNVSYGEPD